LRAHPGALLLAHRQEQREILKHIIREFVDAPDRRIDLVDFWNYLRFREKNPTMPVPKRKRRKKR
jgi:hypothetical protein